MIEPAQMSIEAGGAFADIDGDGDLDIVTGEDYSGNRMFWWENPYPNYDPNTRWTRRQIKSSGQNRHHDQVFGDFNGDGQEVNRRSCTSLLSRPIRAMLVCGH